MPIIILTKFIIYI